MEFVHFVVTIIHLMTKILTFMPHNYDNCSCMMVVPYLVMRIM